MRPFWGTEKQPYGFKKAGLRPLLRVSPSASQREAQGKYVPCEKPDGAEMRFANKYGYKRKDVFQRELEDTASNLYPLTS